MISTFLRADRLRLATLFQSKDLERPYINGVRIEAAGNTGVRLISTDGHRLAVFHDEAGTTDAACTIALPKTAAAAVKSAKMRDFLWFGVIGAHDGTGRHEARIIDTSDGIRGLDEAREAMEDPCDRNIVWSGAVDLIGGEYPDWQKVIPAQAAEAAPGAHFNAKLIVDFGSVANDLDSKRTPILRVFMNGNEPAIVDCGRSDFVGIIPPMRDSGATTLIKNGPIYTPPDWAT